MAKLRGSEAEAAVESVFFLHTEVVGPTANGGVWYMYGAPSSAETYLVSSLLSLLPLEP
jgi:hypothetical protein